MDREKFESMLPCKIGDTIYVRNGSDSYINLEVLDFVYYKSCGLCVVAGYFNIPRFIRPLYDLGKEFFLSQYQISQAMAKEKGEKS